MKKLIAVLAIIVVAVVAFESHAAAAKTKRLSPGVVNVDGTSSLAIFAFNGTDSAKHVVVSLESSVGFSASSPTSLLVPAHGKAVTSFACPGSGGCTGAPIVKTPAGVVLAAEWTQPSTGSDVNIDQALAGDWKPI